MVQNTRLAPGSWAPEFRLVAAGSGRRVSLRDAAGRKLVLIFHLQETAAEARAVNQAIRDRYASADEAFIASVIDLSIVPPLYQPMVAPILSNAYRETAAEVPKGLDPADYVVILPDWTGLVSRRYGARGTGRAALVVVVDEESRVVGTYQGENPVEATLELLDQGTL